MLHHLLISKRQKNFQNQNHVLHHQHCKSFKNNPRQLFYFILFCFFFCRSFNDILNLAAKKQHEEIVIPAQNKKQEERLLTKKEKEELEEKLAREKRRQMAKAEELKGKGRKEGEFKSKSAATNISNNNLVKPEGSILEKRLKAGAVNPSNKKLTQPEKPQKILEKQQSSSTSMQNINKKLIRDTNDKKLLQNKTPTNRSILFDEERKLQQRLEQQRTSSTKIKTNKRKILDDSEEEDDSDMDSFIDDGDAEADVSGFIKEIFGYDKSRFVLSIPFDYFSFNDTFFFSLV